MILNVYNRTKAKLPLSTRYLKNVLVKSARTLGINVNFEITLLIVSAKEIRSLNKKYRHKDKATDVLSFSQKEGSQLILPKKKNTYLGDIIICLEQAKKQATSFKHSLKEEFSLLLIHGFLHLLGYKDESKKDDFKMQKIQNKLLAKIYD